MKFTSKMENGGRAFPPRDKICPIRWYVAQTEPVSKVYSAVTQTNVATNTVGHNDWEDGG